MFVICDTCHCSIVNVDWTWIDMYEDGETLFDQITGRAEMLGEYLGRDSANPGYFDCDTCHSTEVGPGHAYAE